MDVQPPMISLGRTFSFTPLSARFFERRRPSGTELNTFFPLMVRSNHSNIDIASFVEKEYKGFFGDILQMGFKSLLIISHYQT